MTVSPSAEDVITSAAGLPIIDFGNFTNGTPARREAAVAEIDQACRRHGMFYLSNHGIPEDTMRSAFTALQEFFALPVKEKELVGPAVGDGWHNDIDPQAEIINFREGYRLGFLANDHPLVLEKKAMPTLWPDRPTNFQQAMVEYSDAVRRLARQILQALALALGLDESFFAPHFSQGYGVMHPAYYPPQPPDERRVGRAAHTDFGAMTVLAQDSPGLQVLDGDGVWLAVPPIEGTLVVNLGRLMVRWSNDVFVCATHRVLNTSGTERYSIPCFCDPDPDAIVTCAAADGSEKYPPIKVAEYIESLYPMGRPSRNSQSKSVVVNRAAFGG